MKKKAAYLIILICLLPLLSFGQDSRVNVRADRNSETKVELERTVMLENDSEVEDVLIEINEKTRRLELMIASKVRNGKITIEIYDPKGVKQGAYTVGTLLSSEKEETVNGNIRKSLFEPQVGKWKIRIIPIDATGGIQIQTVIAESNVKN